MAEVALTFLLENLQNMVVHRVDLISGLKDELNQLQIQLHLMRDLLQKLGSKKGVSFTEFEKTIIEKVYDVEDIIDAYLTQAAASNVLRFMSTRMTYLKLTKALRELNLQPILDRAREILEVAEPSGTSTSAQEQKATDHEGAPISKEDTFVGFEDEAYTIMKYLNEETRELDVISIVGMGGIGKTTLALKIYQDPEIRYEFPILIWVFISPEFNMKEVCLTILEKFTKEDMSELTESLLADLVRNNLENHRFLLIMDDVWSVEDWKKIKVALPNKTSGKVLITSRIMSVAAHANHNREPFQLRFLNYDESWELLQLQVFGMRNICPPELKELGMHIAKQCNGLPLALVVIGGILQKKGVDRKDLWEKVSGSVSVYLHDDGHERMTNIISLSYNNLPYHLRVCFLYLGMFPEDTEIPVWKLTRLWIAEGFVHLNQGECLEEVAGEYLNDLVARNLVIVGKTKANGDVKTCRVHDLIREFCQNVAAPANMNFFREVKEMRESVFDPAISAIDMNRRLCIHSNVIEFLQGKPKGRRVRSFVCFSKEAIHLPPKYIQSIPEAFDLLRVIDASPIIFTKFPSKLTKLIHLRYIALSVREFKALPHYVSKLWNLQTLNIQTTSCEFEIKADISKMMQLRHLKTKAAIVLNKGTKDQSWENLQTLSRLSAQSLTSDICDKAFNLKNLGIRGQLSTLMNTTCLARLDRLEKLKLVHDAYPNVTSENPLIGLPPLEAFPPNLRILNLSSTLLKWEHMSTLGMLHTLEVLNLKDNAFMGISWKVDDGCFPFLEVLQIQGTDLEVWTASEYSFPRLRCLVLKNCERLEGIPDVLVKTLQEVDIIRGSKSAVDSARRMKMEKEEMQVQGRASKGGFKLVISPGDEI